jgi:hypothetical protein
VNLITEGLHIANGKVKIKGHLTKVLKTERGMGQGDALSTILFNITLKKAIRISDNNGISYNTT